MPVQHQFYSHALCSIRQFEFQACSQKHINCHTWESFPKSPFQTKVVGKAVITEVCASRKSEGSEVHSADREAFSLMVMLSSL